jgi:hypothetical protein
VLISRQATAEARYNMHVYFRDICLGVVKDAALEGLWITGEFEAFESAEVFRDFFMFIVDEESEQQDMPFDEAWFDEENWYVIDELGEKRGMSVPGVYPDGMITWRTR